MLALGSVRLSAIDVCADTAYNVFNSAHTDPRLAEALRRSSWTDLDDWRGSAG